MRPIDAIKYGENLVWLIGHGEFSSPQDALRRALYDLGQTPALALDDLRPKGRWVNKNGRCGCSECRQGIRSTFEGLEMWLDMSTLPYCPFCGADMRGGGENE